MRIDYNLWANLWRKLMFSYHDNISSLLELSIFFFMNFHPRPPNITPQLSIEWIDMEETTSLWNELSLLCIAWGLQFYWFLCYITLKICSHYRQFFSILRPVWLRVDNIYYQLSIKQVVGHVIWFNGWMYELN